MTMKIFLLVACIAFASNVVSHAKIAKGDSLVQMVSSTDEDIPANALVKVLRMIDRLKMKINNETKLSLEFNEKYLKWCANATQTCELEIAHHQELADKFYAILLRTSGQIKEAQAAIDEATADLVMFQTQLRRATEDRDRERAEFEKNIGDLRESIEAINKAVAILEVELKKNPSLAQLNTKNVHSLLQTFNTILEAVAVPTMDRQKLVALVQSNQAPDEPDDTGDIDAQAYQARSGDIVNLLIDLRAKAEQEIRDLQDDEIQAQGAYDLLKIDLDNQIKEQQKVVDEHKEKKAVALKEHAEVEKDYNKAKSDVDHNTELLKKTTKDCHDWKHDHERFLDEQAKEIDVLNKCIAFINEAIETAGGVQDMTSAGDITTPSASEQMWVDFHQKVVSLFQLGAHGDNLVKAQVVGIVKDLARKHKNSALMQLASRIKVLLRYSFSSKSKDPFAKVINLIKDMIVKLETNLEHEQDEMAFCNKDMNETKEKMIELGIDIEKLDRLHEASYMREVNIHEWLQRIADAIAAEEAERAERVTIFNENERNYYLTRDQLVDALEAVRKAITMLTEFYGEPPVDEAKEAEEEGKATVQEGETQHEKTEAAAKEEAASFLQESHACKVFQARKNAFLKENPMPVFLQEHTDHNASANMSAKKRKFIQGHGIIEMLTIIEDDLAESLRLEDEMFADNKVDHEDVLRAYLKSRKINEGDKDFYNSEEATQHRITGQTEEDENNTLNEKEQLAVYYLHLRDRCIARPERFDDRKKARDDEIRGLKQALNILEDETSYIQTQASAQRLRGLRRNRQKLEDMALRTDS